MRYTGIFPTFDYRLGVFFTVAKRLSFTGAASELYISQPAVTKHIKELENQLKIKLFNRNGNSIELTEAGAKLYEFSKQFQKLHREVEYELSVLRNKNEGTIRIGAGTTLLNIFYLKN